MAVLYLAGVSTRTMAMISNRLLGIDQFNKRSILAIIEPGFKDSAKAGKSVFHSLIERGLDVSSVKLGIMDGLPHLEKSFVEYFPAAKAQRCWVHSLANATSRTPKRLQLPFKRLVHSIMYVDSQQFLA